MFDLSPYSGGILRTSYGNYMQLSMSISVIPQHGKSEVVLQFINDLRLLTTPSFLKGSNMACQSFNIILTGHFTNQYVFHDSS
jgi:hypothetical protein